VALDPDFRSAVERAREMASERGELLDGPGDSPGQGISPAARAAVTDWVYSCDYNPAVAEVVADVPDLQTL
jgi:hypothetical protein